jgi:ubiquitin carboxyl-terminal hydrolase 14
VGSNNSGYYELVGVMSHKGRSSDSGHYVAWVRGRDGRWLLFDDDSVNVVPEKDILRLSGSQGGGGTLMKLFLLFVVLVA